MWGGFQRPRGGIIRCRGMIHRLTFWPRDSSDGHKTIFHPKRRRDSCAPGRARKRRCSLLGATQGFASTICSGLGFA